MLRPSGTWPGAGLAPASARTAGCKSTLMTGKSHVDPGLTVPGHREHLKGAITDLRRLCRPLFGVPPLGGLPEKAKTP